jgi:predicted phosphodiesterase
MKCAVLADIHANLEAMEAAISFLQKEGISRIIILGDVIGYGASPVECLNLVRSIQASCLRGNHEEAAITGAYETFSTNASACMKWTITQLNDSLLQDISSWPEKLNTHAFFACHGSPLHLLSGYIHTRSRAYKVFQETSFPLIFYGHTHFPLAFSFDPESGLPPKIIAPDPGGTLRIRFEPHLRYLVNTGSVGQPRDGIPAVCCGIFDPDQQEFSLHRIPYDWKSAAEKIEKAGLPSFIAQRLSKGV